MPADIKGTVLIVVLLLMLNGFTGGIDIFTTFLSVLLETSRPVKVLWDIKDINVWFPK